VAEEAKIPKYPVPRSIAPTRDDSLPLLLMPGKVVGLEGPAGWGLTRLGLSLLAAPSQVGTVVAVDVRGWLSPMAAWEEGVLAHRLVLVRSPHRRLWSQVIAALLEGVAAVYAEVPVGIGEAELRRLAALARARRAGLALRPLRGPLPAGIIHSRIKGMGVEWHGPGQGHGRLRSRVLTVELAGKSIPPQTLELSDGPEEPRISEALTLSLSG
jgi:hypothetical protein